MAKFVSQAAQDAELDLIATCVTWTLCSAQPADFAGIAAVKLASYTIDGTDFTKSAWATTGRQIEVASQSGNNATASGTGTYFVFDDGTTLHMATPLSASVNTTSGQPVNFGSLFYRKPQPV